MDSSSDSELEFEGSHENSADEEKEIEETQETLKYYINYSGSALEELLELERQEQFRKSLKVVRNPIDRIKAFIYNIVGEYNTPVGVAYLIFNLAVVVWAVVLVLVESWPDYHYSVEVPEAKWFLQDTAIVAIFTFDFCIRMLTAPDLKKFFFNIYTAVDLAAIIPYFIECFSIVFGFSANASWTAVLRVLRIMRIFMVFKFGRMVIEINSALAAFGASLFSIAGVMVLFIVFWIICSSCLYYAEQTEADFDSPTQQWIYNDDSNSPGKISPFQSVPHTLWWGVVSMATVGYGDTFPITPIGKAVAGVSFLIGILILSLPVGFLTDNFGRFVTDRLEKQIDEAYFHSRRKMIVHAKYADLLIRMRAFDSELHSVQNTYEDIVAQQTKMASHLDKQIAKHEESFGIN